jgi:hypothetical protein
MIIPIPAMILAAQLAIPVADGPPQFNLEPTCRGATTGSATIRGDKEICQRKENQARDELSGQWANFPGGDRSRCIQSTSAGGIPSYVELLTCLEIAKQARELPKDDGRTTTGAASSR